MQTEGDFMENVVIVDGVRTPFVKAGADFAKVSAVDLGVRAFQEAVERAGVAWKDIDEVFIGNIAQPADSANVARVISLFAGAPERSPALTVQRNCASGMESIAQGAMAISSGRAQVVVAGGTESMSQIPMMFSESLKNIFMSAVFAKNLGQRMAALSKFKFSSLKPIIGLEEGLRDPVSGMMMGQTGERLARDFGISRREQDEFALRSHQKAVAAKNKLQEEIVALYPGFKKIVEHDVGPRDGQTLEALGKLSPYFEKPHGTVTVGNACPITDGACMLVLMSETKAKADGYKILGYLKSFAFAGCDPSRMGLGPVFAAPKALELARLTMKQMNLVEINEAFAAQVLACVKALGSREFAKTHFGRDEAIGEVDMDRLNVNGGAIALGHPVGTSGARLVLTVLKELKRRQQEYGLASLCIGGGQGGACIVQAA